MRAAAREARDDAAPFVAAPYICLSTTLLLGLGRLLRHDSRREIVIVLLGLVWVLNVSGVVVLVVSLVFHSAVHITGRQLLLSGGTAWFTNAIAFGLAFWELDSGGPVARAFSAAPRKPDFQFPQDENPQLAREGWAPASGTTYTCPSPMQQHSARPTRCP